MLQIGPSCLHQQIQLFSYAAFNDDASVFTETDLSAALIYQWSAWSRSMLIHCTSKDAEHGRWLCAGMDVA